MIMQIGIVIASTSFDLFNYHEFNQSNQLKVQDRLSINVKVKRKSAAVIIVPVKVSFKVINQ